MYVQSHIFFNLLIRFVMTKKCNYIICINCVK